MAKEETADEYNIKVIKKIILIAFIGIFGLIILIGSWFTVSAGQRAILVTLGNPSDVVYAEGIHFKLPLVQSIVKMDVKTQKYDAKASAASQDLQTVNTEVTINYKISSDSVTSVYKNIGLDYQDKIIQPAVQEVVKAATAEFTAEELITKRPEVKDRIDIGLRERLVDRGIIIQDILITDFDFSESFNAAIEAKVTAEQNALAAKNKLAQVEYEAQQRVTQAKGEAEAIRIQSQAIQAQGGRDYVQLQAIKAWDGHLPMVTGGSIPFINLNVGNSITSTNQTGGIQ